MRPQSFIIKTWCGTETIFPWAWIEKEKTKIVKNNSEYRYLPKNHQNQALPSHNNTVLIEVGSRRNRPRSSCIYRIRITLSLTLTTVYFSSTEDRGRNQHLGKCQGTGRQAHLREERESVMPQYLHCSTARKPRPYGATKDLPPWHLERGAGSRLRFFLGEKIDLLKEKRSSTVQVGVRCKLLWWRPDELVYYFHVHYVYISFFGMIDK